jgi:DNA-binding NarL/FixJ family response regulator
MEEQIRVLVADDSRLFREALAEFVAHLDGVIVVGRARDGQEAVELAGRTGAQVVFMDLVMPRLDGLSATRFLKGKADAPAVVICTTDEDERLHDLAIGAGADAFLHKRYLVDRAEPLLRRLAGASLWRQGARR